MSIKQRIIEESTAMFTTYGLKGVRMDDIANAMGISKRTIYETFGDKENLIMACIEYFFEEKARNERCRTEGAGNVVEKMLMGLRQSEDVIQKSFSLINDLCKFYPKIYDAMSEESFDTGARELVNDIRTGIEQGVFIPYINIDLAVALFMDNMRTIVRRRTDSSIPREVSLSEVMKYNVLFFFRGIATLKGIEMIDTYLTEKYNVQ